MGLCFTTKTHFEKAIILYYKTESCDEGLLVFIDEKTTLDSLKEAFESITEIGFISNFIIEGISISQNYKKQVEDLLKEVIQNSQDNYDE